MNHTSINTNITNTSTDNLSNNNKNIHSTNNITNNTADSSYDLDLHLEYNLRNDLDSNLDNINISNDNNMNIANSNDEVPPTHRSASRESTKSDSSSSAFPTHPQLPPLPPLPHGPAPSFLTSPSPRHPHYNPVSHRSQEGGTGREKEEIHLRVVTPTNARGLQRVPSKLNFGNELGSSGLGYERERIQKKEKHIDRGERDNECRRSEE